MTQPLGTVSPIGALPARPRQVDIGSRIRFFGAEYIVDRIHQHPSFGEFWAMHDVVDGRYELISAKGNDGNFEVIA